MDKERQPDNQQGTTHCCIDRAFLSVCNNSSCIPAFYDSLLITPHHGFNLEEADDADADDGKEIDDKSQ